MRYPNDDEIDYMKCEKCEQIPTRYTAKYCKICKEGFDEHDLNNHDKG